MRCSKCGEICKSTIDIDSVVSVCCGARIEHGKATKQEIEDICEVLRHIAKKLTDMSNNNSGGLL